jgi:hypothetical protein
VADVLAQIQALVALGEVRPSLHGFRELAADGILLDDLLIGVRSAVVIEDYLDATRGRGIPQTALSMWFGAFEKTLWVRL